MESFDVASLTVTIKLPFGQMYSHVSRVVCWCDWSSSSTDSGSASEAALIQSYDALHATSLLSIPWSEKLAMQDLVSSLPPSNADEDGGTVTDKEDGENESESDSPSDNDEEDDEEGGEAMDEEEDGSVQSRTNEIAEFLTHTGDATASNHNQQQQSNRNSSSSSSSSSASAVAAVFPIANTVPAAHTRREVKTKLAAERELHLRSVTTDKLKIALAPPGALPYLLSSSSSGDSSNSRVKFDLAAFDEPYAVPLGSTGSLCYDGDVAALRSSLQSIGNQIAQLKNSNHQLARRMNYSRAACTRIASETAALRVGMFTRRIVHRNNLGSAGVVYGGPPAPTSTVAMASSSSATSVAPASAVEVKTESAAVAEIKQEQSASAAEEAGYSSSTSLEEVMNGSKRDATHMEGDGTAGAGGDKDETSPVENKKKSAKRTRRSY